MWGVLVKFKNTFFTLLLHCDVKLLAKVTVLISYWKLFSPAILMNIHASPLVVSCAKKEFKM